ncbi:hypothetical protein ON010_g15839 [Phytophthora cinnamomi]|nr:hypothetical protein ON010_g15839 [Phytophthora cinnamomi]
MIIAATTSDEIQEVKVAINNTFKMKEFGETKFILGIEINHDYSAKTLVIKQTRCIDDVVKRFYQQDAKLVRVGPGVDEDSVTDDARRTCDNAGKATLSSHWMHHNVHSPGCGIRGHAVGKVLDRKAAVRVFWYLKYTQDLASSTIATEKIVVGAYTDADWGRNLDHRRRSPERWLRSAGRRWSSSRSTTARRCCGPEPCWRAWATSKWECGRITVALASNAGYNTRTKHVDVKNHFIRENVARGTIAVDYVQTMDQLADMLTKAVGTKRRSTCSRRAESPPRPLNPSDEWECLYCVPPVQAGRTRTRQRLMRRWRHGERVDGGHDTGLATTRLGRPMTDTKFSVGYTIMRSSQIQLPVNNIKGHKGTTWREGHRTMLKLHNHGEGNDQQDGRSHPGNRQLLPLGVRYADDVG